MSQNALQTLGNMKISTVAKQSKYADQALGEGIAAPFAVIGFKGGKWSIRHRGSTHILERKDASGRSEGPVPFLDLVILFAATHHSKVYYAKGYQEGDDRRPDCWSTNGNVPDQAVEHPVNPSCHNCPKNEFGSRMNQATGARGKACSDTRRMAVVPYQDIENTIMGGPMLLRIPPASLGAVGEYSDMLKANAIPYSAIATRVGFDPKEAYPKMMFEPFAALTDDQSRQMLQMQKHPLVERIVQQQMENIPDQPTAEQGTETPKPNGSPIVTTPVTYADASNQAVQRQAIEVAATPQPEPEAPPAVTALTPEQLRIQELEAKLAAAEAKPTKGPGRKRTQPVAPQPVAVQHTSPEAPVEEGEEDGSGSGAVTQGNDPALASISARLSKILS